MSRQEEKLNKDINELQRFVHDTRRQALFSQGNLTYYQTRPYCNSPYQQLSP